MSGILGLINLTGKPVAPASLHAMRDAMGYWGPDGGDLWNMGATGLGQLRLFDTPESRYEALPRWLPQARLAFTAEARIDNRDKLCDIFDIPTSERLTTPDSELILLAYLKWGEKCPDYLLGDWSCAVWHPDEQRLFVARDHQGITALYYFRENGRFAFASSRKALLALGAPRRLNELYLAQILISWPAYQGERTVDLDIFRLPPAHAMCVTPQETKVWRYWRLEDTPDLHMSSFQDCVEGFLDVYGEAVRCRLRSYRSVGVTLSGGLDSGSVTALAARELKTQGKRLAAFTAVPLYDTEAFLPAEKRYGDESEYAASISEFTGNVEQHLVRTEDITPLDGIFEALQTYDEPQHAVGNFYWVFDTLRCARQGGIGTLLTGQGGNASVSWTGSEQSLRWNRRARRAGLGQFFRQQIKECIPDRWRTQVIRRALASRIIDARARLNPDFVRRIGLYEALARDATHPLVTAGLTPREQRFRIIKPGRALMGGLLVEGAASASLDMVDPTVDIRVLRYCIGVPDRFYWGPSATDDRWLIRSAMQGRLPDAVRLNRRRGRQSADVVVRLRKEAVRIDNLLAQMADGSPAELLDLVALKSIWRRAQCEDSNTVRVQINSILLRSLMVGVFLLEMDEPTADTVI